MVSVASAGTVARMTARTFSSVVEVVSFDSVRRDREKKKQEYV